jgi:two-component system, OmpR family, phosphate regulon response regulator PhoB
MNRRWGAGALRTGPHAARHHPTVRSVVFRFESVAAFSAALGEATGALAVPEGETVADGEWILATFEVGSRRRATAAAGRVVCAAGDTHVAFERRDWDRLLQFVAARSEHMRAARPLTSGGPPSTGVHAVSSGKLPISEAYEHEAPPSSVLESSRVPFGARVLLVDDDAANREEIRIMLAGIGLMVEVVEVASDAQSRLLETPFDALVLDFHTPGVEPLDFVRGLRRDPLLAPLPVLILSDRPSSRDVVDAFASGADDFLPKPFRAPELGARIFGLLRRARLARLGSLMPGGPHSTRGGGIP